MSDSYEYSLMLTYSCLRFLVYIKMLFRCKQPIVCPYKIYWVGEWVFTFVYILYMFHTG